MRAYFLNPNLHFARNADFLPIVPSMHLLYYLEAFQKFNYLGGFFSCFKGIVPIRYEVG